MDQKEFLRLQKMVHETFPPELRDGIAAHIMEKGYLDKTLASKADIEAAVARWKERINAVTVF